MKLLQLLEENRNTDMFICREEFEGYNSLFLKKIRVLFMWLTKTGNI